MRLFKVWRLASALILATGSASVVAEPEVPLARVLTCNLQADTPYFSGAENALKGRTINDDHGGMRIAGPLHFGDLCIENVYVAAAFGVFAVAARLCDGEPKPLTDFVRRVEPGLEPNPIPLQPGFVAIYQAPRYSLVIFRGEPGLPAEPDPTSARLSYTCTYVGSGPQ